MPAVQYFNRQVQAALRRNSQSPAMFQPTQGTIASTGNDLAFQTSILIYIWRTEKTFETIMV